MSFLHQSSLTLHVAAIVVLLLMIAALFHQVLKRKGSGDSRVIISRTIKLLWWLRMMIGLMALLLIALATGFFGSPSHQLIAILSVAMVAALFLLFVFDRLEKELLSRLPTQNPKEK